MSTSLKRRLEKLIEAAGLSSEDQAEVTQRAEEFVSRIEAMTANASPIALTLEQRAEALVRFEAIVADVQRETAHLKVRA
jgi:hypothetical protein